jgi:ubiquinone/menaquinone biosynthesis C-methylase UbiE
MQIDNLMRGIEARGIKFSRGKALDFGCGVGNLSQALCNYFHEVYAVDIAPSTLEIANKYNRHAHKCKYIHNNADNLRIFSDNSFDFIFSSGVLVSMQPRYAKKYIREFLRILRPQGLLVFQLYEFRHKPIIRLRQFIKLFIPKILLNFYRKLKGKDVPEIDIYSMTRRKFIPFLQTNGGKILATVAAIEKKPFFTHVVGLTSVWYGVTKE